MPKLIIKRNSEWATRMRTFDIYLNEKKLVEINDKQVFSFEIPEGRYQLRAKIDWCGSEPLNIEIEKGETKRIEVKGFIFSKYFLPVALISGILYFIIYFKFNINSLLLATLLMFFLGYLLFFVSFGRNQYLRLNEV